MRSKQDEMKFGAEVSYLKLISEGNLRYRFVSQGLDLKVVEEALGSVKTQGDWLSIWTKVGDMYQRLGDEALTENHVISAGEFFLKATLAFHWAQLLHFHDLPGKQRAHLAKLNVHTKARPLLAPPIRRLEASLEGVSIPIFIRTPPGPGPYPTVIIVCGTDSTKEENFVMENCILARNLAVVSFDGPGQGEVWPAMKMRPDFHKAVSAVIDVVCTQPEVDKNHLVLLGKSFGGFLGPSAVAHDKRLKACVANGGYFDTSFYDWDEPLRSVRWQYVLGAQAIEEAKEAAKEFTLANCIHEVRVPLLVIHGGQDRTVPTSAAKRIADEAAGPAAFIEFPEGIHCTHNIAYEVNPMIADWLADHAKGVTITSLQNH